MIFFTPSNNFRVSGSISREAASFIVFYQYYCRNLSNYNTRVVGGPSLSRQFSTNGAPTNSNEDRNLSDIPVFGPGEKLPSVQKFTNLHLTASVSAAKKTLKVLCGVYALVCQKTGGIYIGSSSDLSQRLNHHVSNHSSNAHLQNAINKYGLENFVLIVVEYYKFNPDFTISDNVAQLLAREQYWLD
jgi:hypothetical protein